MSIRKLDKAEGVVDRALDRLVQYKHTARVVVITLAVLGIIGIFVLVT